MSSTYEAMRCWRNPIFSRKDRNPFYLFCSHSIRLGNERERKRYESAKTPVADALSQLAPSSLRHRVSFVPDGYFRPSPRTPSFRSQSREHPLGCWMVSDLNAPRR